MRTAHFIVACLSLCLFFSCGKKQEDEEDCPSFENSQLYPPAGGPGTLFELFVLLKDKDPNEKVEGIRADLYTSNGAVTGKSFNLVRSDVDARRYLRQFDGSDLCDADERVCNLFFRVVATHEKGCRKGFDTDLIQVAYTQDDLENDDDDDTGDDDDDTGADDDDTGADDDSTDDDSSDDDSAEI